MTKATYLRMQCERTDFIERDKCHAFLELPILQQVLADQFVLHNDVEQLTTSSDLQCR
jgi:hypothetical protein